ncbi:unnamed protein product, partial [Amoebophrya sp. A120]
QEPPRVAQVPDGVPFYKTEYGGSAGVEVKEAAGGNSSHHGTTIREHQHNKVLRTGQTALKQSSSPGGTKTATGGATNTEGGLNKRSVLLSSHHSKRSSRKNGPRLPPNSPKSQVLFRDPPYVDTTSQALVG